MRSPNPAPAAHTLGSKSGLEPDLARLDHLEHLEYRKP